MPIEVRLVLPIDLDILQRCGDVEGAAFGNSHVTPVVFPGPFPANSGEEKAKALAADMREEGARIFAAFDTDLQGVDAVVGYAKWYVYEDAMPKPKPRKFGAGVNLEAAQHMFGAIDGLRERNMSGKPCVYLSVLVVHPDHQGKGVGRQLMSWGLQEAARLGVPSFLESSVSGRPLYLKSGFKEVEAIEVSFEKFGLDQPFRNWAMVWEVPTLRCP